MRTYYLKYFRITDHWGRGNALQWLVHFRYWCSVKRVMLVNRSVIDSPRVPSIVCDSQVLCRPKTNRVNTAFTQWRRQCSHAFHALKGLADQLWTWEVLIAVQSRFRLSIKSVGLAECSMSFPAKYVLSMSHYVSQVNHRKNKTQTELFTTHCSVL